MGPEGRRVHPENRAQVDLMRDQDVQEKTACACSVSCC